jgi:hypothetical protein
VAYTLIFYITAGHKGQGYRGYGVGTCIRSGIYAAALYLVTGGVG